MIATTGTLIALRVIRFIKMKLHLRLFSYSHFLKSSFPFILHLLKISFLSKKCPVFYHQSFQNRIGPKRVGPIVCNAVITLHAFLHGQVLQLCRGALDDNLTMLPLYIPTSTTYPFWARKADWPWWCWTKSQLPPDRQRMDAACGDDDDISGCCVVVYF